MSGPPADEQAQHEAARTRRDAAVGQQARDGDLQLGLLEQVLEPLRDGLIAAQDRVEAG